MVRSSSQIFLRLISAFIIAAFVSLPLFLALVGLGAGIVMRDPVLRRGRAS